LNAFVNSTYQFANQTLANWTISGEYTIETYPTGNHSLRITANVTGAVDDSDDY